MKLKSSEIARFVANPAKAVRAFLIYGADEGLGREYFQTLLKSLKINANDPLNVSNLDAAEVLSEPSIIYDALFATSLMGDEQCVVVRRAGNKLTDIIVDIYSSNTELNYLFLLAGELESRASLVGIAEKSANMVAIPCYRAEGGALNIVIKETLQSHKLIFDEKIVELMAQMLGNDRAIIRGEIAKIALYMGNERNLTSDIVLKCCGDNQHLMLNETMLQWLSGDLRKFNRNIVRMLQAGESMVAAFRVLQYLSHNICAMVEKHLSGVSIDDAVKFAYPFTLQPLYKKAIIRFKNPSDLMRLQRHMLQWEALSKTTGMQDFMLLNQLYNYKV
jgi:DNA polymerase III subunit delta